MAHLLPERSGDKCWVWQGCKDKNGYGRMTYHGKDKRAHRIAYALFHGEEPPSNILICHRCDNPSCVNPKHLFAGTNGDNVRDMVRKGHHRDISGEANPMAKLTEADVIEIRKMIADGFSKRIIAHQFGVSERYIYYIVTKRTWKHI